MFTVAGDQGTGLQTFLCQTVAAEMEVLTKMCAAVSAHFGCFLQCRCRFRRQPVDEHQQRRRRAGERRVRKKLNAQAAKLIGCAEDQVVYKGGKFSVKGSKGKPLTLSQVVQANEGPVTVSIETEVPRKGSSTSFIAQVAEVEVDPETGRVTLNKFVSAHDVGTIINPLGHQGQIDGETIMAIGSSLMEELIDDQGKITTTNLGEYKIPEHRRYPKAHHRSGPGKNGPGPYEAKGIGEHANVSSAGGDRQRGPRRLWGEFVRRSLDGGESLPSAKGEARGARREA